ncbi:hypothetical protein C499_11686 [Halogeometricum borinquense DSM 11551]|uniref:Uncharacterized protein n=1 Tax=Halogeometricum borinquense (strain ATCC 700274 / DSM 11551 / JCM 10706 / KCTC 4070 / PR3) TaxID=469382 RepID=E4NSX6_HALBP|nr:hypothetical protein [Halogeometricum borinquense]ADQ65864.1 hypothetical protein Hbor_02540 [Halogeometricum borinquense DSM 11551]ELY26866.1 hypothetical protein C499_11686 [Halogeometricum borinquense DSM 11551]
MPDETLTAADADTLRERLLAARDAHAAAEADIESIGEESVVAAADAYRKAIRLLDNYEESAVGTGDFQAYVEFQDKFLGLVEELPEELPDREAFEAAADRMDRRRLRERDFEGARADLEAAESYVEYLDHRTETKEELTEARRDAKLLLKDTDSRISELERLVELGEADVDAPVEHIRDPIDRYNEAVSEEFQSFKQSESAQEVLSVVEAAEWHSLVEFRSPPRDLREFVRESPDADEPIPTLLEYADYTGSKLDHYAEDPAMLQTSVAVHRTYLERLDADPLCVSFPPPSAETLRRKANELVSVLDRFASETTIAALRTVRELTRRDDYDRLRTAARARTELTDAELERLRSGAVETELHELREAHDKLADALSEADG